MATTYTAPEDFVQFAHALADSAGEIVRRHFAAAPAVERKADTSPVTQTDRDIEAAMRRMIENQFPDHGIFGEEHGRKNENARWQWVLDPIDGTRSFIAGYPIFTTLIALVRGDVPVLGIIDQAILGERWVGVSGATTTRNGTTVKASQNTELKHAPIATTSTPYYFDAMQTAAFERLRKQCGSVIVGGDAYGYAQLASGRIGFFVDACLKPYDFCALVPVVEGAGGVITDWAGKPLTLGSKGDTIAAANPQLHKQAIALLQVS